MAGFQPWSSVREFLGKMEQAGAQGLVVEFP